MAETLDALVEHLDLQPQPTKVVVWAHNSHPGDARATQMGQAGEWNVGQLVRHGKDCRLIGFSTYTGTVTAASNWDGPAERKQVRPARADSYEGLFHHVCIPAFGLTLEPRTHVTGGLSEPMLERAIGVVYLPESELVSHYFQAQLSDQFGEPAETFPSGI